MATVSVIFKEGNPEMRFDELPVGEHFMFLDTVWRKVSETQGNNLKTSENGDIGGNQIVRKLLNIEITATY